MISNEDDVRSHVRDVSNGKARWVEPALGSSFGMPDCWLPEKGHCVHVELKCGELKAGVLRYKVRPEQKKQLQLLKLDKIPCGLLIGIKGSDVIIAARVNAESLSGRIQLDAPTPKGGEKEWISVVPHKVQDWRRTVSFFFGG